MFCFNCGTKLVDDAKFCSNCGTKIDVNVLQESQQEAQLQHLAIPTQGQKLQHAPVSQSKIFNLLGYEVEIPKETEDYVSIHNNLKELGR
jgi:uncharacterized membrane protein YvbJ